MITPVSADHRFICDNQEAEFVSSLNEEIKLWKHFNYVRQSRKHFFTILYAKLSRPIRSAVEMIKCGIKLKI